MAESQNFEAIVIGAGVMGSSAAYFLSKTLGKNVLLLEQFDRLHRRGSSHGESRMIRMTYVEDFNTSLMFDAYKFWDEIEAEAKTKLFTKTGGLSIGQEDNENIQSVKQNLDKFNIEYEILTPKTVTKKFPAITLPDGYIGIYDAKSGMLNPTKSVSTLQTLALQNGCTFLDNMPVTSIIPKLDDNGTEVFQITTKNGQNFTGKKCIVTSGAWTKKLIGKFDDIRFQLRPIQTTIAYWNVSTPELYSVGNFPIFMYYGDPMIYGCPSLEYPNLIKCAGDEGVACDPDSRDFAPETQGLTGYVNSFIKTFLTGIAEKPTLTESCIYTLSPDRQFIIDTLPSHPNLIIGCGFSGHGFKLGPLVGKILSDLATVGKHPYPHVHQHFSLQRFQ